MSNYNTWMNKDLFRDEDPDCEQLDYSLTISQRLVINTLDRIHIIKFDKNELFKIETNINEVVNPDDPDIWGEYNYIEY